jgi:hypothetical protein
VDLVVVQRGGCHGGKSLVGGIRPWLAWWIGRVLYVLPSSIVYDDDFLQEEWKFLCYRHWECSKTT